MSIEFTLFIPEPAVWISEIPLAAFWIDMFVERSCDSSLFATANPAASSEPDVTRKPDDNFFMLSSIFLLALIAYVRALSAPTFVFITVI